MNQDYLLRPPEKPIRCDYCGAEIQEDKVNHIPTENRYVTYTACPECAKEEIEKQKAELDAAFAQMEDE
jgi:hypothetical protein